MSIQSIASQMPAAPAPTTAAGTAAATGALPARGAPVDAESSRPVPATTPAEQQRQLEAAVKAVQEFTQPMAGSLEFSLDDESGKTIVKVVDTSTDEVIRQIPSEEMLEIARALDRLQGLLVRQKA